ncbi:MAG: rhodanese-like domain-containing protein [Flavobacteriales bacterium]|nr:rhodanese-like domain-containing protein [Flavobacteriales bacterium]
MNYISAKELSERLNSGETIQIIDVRECDEQEICAIEGNHHIPMGDIIERHGEIRTDIPVVVHCKSGQRSTAVVLSLQSKFGFPNLLNLNGGIMAWADEVDQSMEKY